MLYIHELNPVALELFDIKIYWYSLSYIFGFILSLYYSKFLIRNFYPDYLEKNIDDFLTWAVVGVILGGRIGYILFYNLNYYSENPIEILKIWKGGMSFHGGLVGLIISIYLFSFLKKTPFFTLSNIVATCAPIGLFLGRLANFVNGELYGKTTNGEWGVIFDLTTMIPRHPSQLYEAFFEGVVLFFILFFLHKKNKFKQFYPCSIFLIFYASFRFSIEFLREPDYHIGYIFSIFTLGQLLSIPMLILGIILLRPRKNE